MQSRENIIPTKLSISIDDNPAAATGTITSDNTDVSNNDTVTINGRVYTFKTTLTGAADEVLRGVTDADTTLTALRTLINSGRAAVAAAATLTSDNTNVANGATVTIGAKTYTFKTTLTEVKASGTLTSDNTNVSDGDTVTIGSVVYTFKTSLAVATHAGHTKPDPTPYHVLIGADADTSLGNLKAAINGESGEGTKYSLNTPAHSLVTCGSVSSHAVVVTAKAIGTAANDYATTEASSHLSWGGATLASGAASTANEVLIGADADTSLTNLAAAVNGSAGSGTLYSSATVASTEASAGAVAAHAILLTALTAGADGNSLASTETSTHLSFGGAVFAGGVTASAVNADVTCGAVASHVITLTAKTAAATGNAITLAKSAAHLTVSAATLTGGGSTIGTSVVGQDGGLVREIVAVAPDWASTPTYVISLLDADGVEYYTSDSQSENATIAIDSDDVVVSPGDSVKVVTSSVVEETLPISVLLR